MTILYCAVADITLNSEKNKWPINGIRVLDPTNWHIENGTISISAEISSLNKAIPRNQNILAVLAAKLIQTASTWDKRSAGKQALNPLLEFANIFCLDIPEDYIQKLALQASNGWLMLEISKVNIVGVFRRSIHNYIHDSEKKVVEVLLNQLAVKELREQFQALAHEPAKTINKKLHVTLVDFTIDGKLIESKASTYTMKDLQSQTLLPPPSAQPPPSSPAPSDIEERRRLMEAPSEYQVSKNDRSCSCVLM